MGAVRLAEIASATTTFRLVNGGPEDARAAGLCADAMQRAAQVAHQVVARSAALSSAMLAKSNGPSATFEVDEASFKENLADLQRCATALQELQGAHRSATLSAVATGALTPAEAMARVDAVRNLAALALHAWRSAANLSAADK